jgi:hypothetical protein
MGTGSQAAVVRRDLLSRRARVKPSVLLPCLRENVGVLKVGNGP